MENNDVQKWLSYFESPSIEQCWIWTGFMSFFDKWNSLQICYVFGTWLSRNFISFLIFWPGMMSLFGDKPNKGERLEAKDVRRV